MRIVADENMPYLDAFLGVLFPRPELVRVSGRSLTRDDLMTADGLLVRSVTPVNRALLQGTPVRFVGTATIGTDHIDVSPLEALGVTVASAPGCNADAVGDYVLASLVRLSLQRQRRLQDWQVGIVGAGNVGGRLHQRLLELGIRVKACDPPRADQGQSGLVTLDEALGCDLICLHTPLTRNGPYPTYHLIDRERLANLGPDQVLLNAGRGAVIDNQSLVERLNAPEPPKVILDVWEGEPRIDPSLMRLVWQGTPHIAGYSLEGRARGTAMVCEALATHFGLGEVPALEDVLEPAAPVQVLETKGEAGLAEAVLETYDPAADHQRLQDCVDASGSGFDRLRKNYPLRREFASRAVASGIEPETARWLRAAGFSGI